VDLAVTERALLQDLLPHLLGLTWDRVPNVRLQVARVLGQVLPEGKPTGLE
jgi:hypothetical protein